MLVKRTVKVFAMRLPAGVPLEILGPMIENNFGVPKRNDKE